MAIEKLSFGNTAPAQLPQAINPEGGQKELQAADNKMSVEDKEKSNAAKYMIGATALAATVLAGISHKQGWFGKAAKKGEELVNGTAKSTEELAGNVVKNADDIKLPTKDMVEHIDNFSEDYIKKITKQYYNEGKLVGGDSVNAMLIDTFINKCSSKELDEPFVKSLQALNLGDSGLFTCVVKKDGNMDPSTIRYFSAQTFDLKIINALKNGKSFVTPTVG